MFPTSFKFVLAVAATLAFRSAQAQNSPVATNSAGPNCPQVIDLNAVPDPAEAASFYDDTHKDLGRTLVWMQAANAAQPRYWSLYTEARIHLKMKNYPAALATAVRARQLAQAACNDTYEHLSEDIIKVTNHALPSPPASNVLASAK